MWMSDVYNLRESSKELKCVYETLYAIASPIQEQIKDLKTNTRTHVKLLCATYISIIKATTIKTMQK